MNNYVIVTPAHNEQDLIEKTIEAVIRQTVWPARWVIVNDASKDETGDVVEKYCREYDFIRLVNVERDNGRTFSNKVSAFNRGLAETSDASWSFIGNLDADISLEPDYYESILKKFQEDPTLGVAGGMVLSSINGKFVSQDVARDSVAGAVQLFRRRCFEDIGGYVALPFGGIDSAAEIKARMKGWTVRTFPELRVAEHRRTGSATSGPLAARIKNGRLFHSLGYSIWFQFARCIYRAGRPPIIIGSIAELTGYLMGVVCRDRLALEPEVIQYLRLEQRRKLKRLLNRKS